MMNESVGNRDLDKDLRLKEIDLLQGCITRMAQNSFLIKGWTLSIVVAVVALLPQKVSLPQSSIRCICMICIGAFFILDSYSIFLDRCYRVKYDWVVKHRSESDFLFLDMSPKKRPEFKENGDVGLERFSFYKAARRGISLPTVFFYGVLMGIMGFVLG